MCCATAARPKCALRDLSLDEAGDQGAGGLVRAPMHGKVLGVFVKPGERVTRGQRLAIIEAMKMEHTLHRPSTARSANRGRPGAQVAEGAKVMVITPDE